MTDKQKRFCKEYLIDFNATRATIAAGYSKNTARQIGSDNLSKPDIQHEISKLTKKTCDKLDITAEKVLAKVAKIAFSDIKEQLSWKTVLTKVGTDDKGQPIFGYSPVITLKDSDDIDTSNVSEVSLAANGTFKFKTYCADTALYKLMEYLGLMNKANDTSDIPNLTDIADAIRKSDTE